MWDLVVSVPDHCLSFCFLYLTENQIHADSKDSDQTARILWPDYEDE